MTRVEKIKQILSEMDVLYVELEKTMKPFHFSEKLSSPMALIGRAKFLIRTVEIANEPVDEK